MANYPAVMKTGIPQGSGLGQLLFLIYINDLSKGLNAGSKPDMFTDDTKLQQQVTILK